MKYLVLSILIIFGLSLNGCSNQNHHHNDSSPKKEYHQTNKENTNNQMNKTNNENANNQNNKTTDVPKNVIYRTKQSNAIRTVSHPDVITVLVNKKYFLPKNYVPKDLVYPNVSFIFKEKLEKRKMRKEAAIALKKLFAGAKKDHIYLSGVSGYRSYATQKVLFNRYVKEDGYVNARKYSALPGSSEHQSGLAIDVSSSTGKCAATSCFANTKEAKWLDKNSSNYGFIIRYPKGKEQITGYKYEPWHIRYVGVTTAKQIKKRNLTLEEYLNVYPVSK
ncbi:peptidase M15 [Bacillus sp. AFS001701]|nr:M15 family metallopeptidase [Bacillus sp. AFS001701]PET75419.1 peptidase M15 [Bacillus sp. AFS001701]